MYKNVCVCNLSDIVMMCSANLVCLCAFHIGASATREKTKVKGQGNLLPED